MPNHVRAELVCDALHTAAATRSHHTAGVVLLRPRQSVPVGRVRRRVETSPDASLSGTRRQLLGQQRRRVVVRDPETRTHLTNTVRDPQPSQTSYLRLDQPLQQPPATLQPQLPNPNRIRKPPTTSTSRVNYVSSKQREAHTATLQCIAKANVETTRPANSPFLLTGF